VNPQVLAAIIGAVALIAGIVLKWMLDTQGENSRLAAELASRPDPDKVLFQNWRYAFDRFAFKGHYRDEQHYIGTEFSESGRNLFDIAIDDTIQALVHGRIALSTGEGNTPQILQGEGVSRITNPDRRQRMEEVQMALTKIKAALVELRKLEANRPQQDEGWTAWSERTTELYTSIDANRDKIISTLNGIWQELGIPTLPIPTDVDLANYTLDLYKE
jgi:hypothetical protein